jgi:hypothetical protein
MSEKVSVGLTGAAAVRSTPRPLLCKHWLNSVIGSRFEMPPLAGRAVDAACAAATPECGAVTSRSAFTLTVPESAGAPRAIKSAATVEVALGCAAAGRVGS